MSDHRSQPQRIGDTLYPTCPVTGKIAWATEAEAADHGAALLITQGHRRRKYRCPDCGAYHVGRRPKNAGKRGGR